MWFLVATALAGSEVAPPVVGGDPADAHAWPDAVAVMSYGYGICTGTLIAPDVVLTADHCVDDRISSVVLDSTDWYRNGEEVSVVDVIRYPNGQYSYDVAVLILAREVDIEPRVIARDCIVDDDLADGAPVTIVGFGSTRQDGRGNNTTLYEAESVVTDVDCTDIANGCNASVSPGGEIGAGGGGMDSCFGDSGGPLYLPTDRGTYLAGVVSRGWYNTTVWCGQGGIWVRPDAVFDWIEQVTGRQLPDPVCGSPPAPTADPIDVRGRKLGLTVVEPNDPDAGGGHTFAIVEEPTDGRAVIDADGVVTYRAGKKFSGSDALTVEVTDPDGLKGTVVVAVEVAKGCGCATGGAPGAAWLLGLLVLPLVRRRRPSR